MKWHHFYSCVVSTMCQESSILNSESVQLNCMLQYIRWTTYNNCFCLFWLLKSIKFYTVFSRILCPCISVSHCKFSHNRLINRVYLLLKLFWGKFNLGEKTNFGKGICMYAVFITVRMNLPKPYFYRKKIVVTSVCSTDHWSILPLQGRRHLCKLVYGLPLCNASL